MLALRPSSSLSTGHVVPFREDWAIFCHAGTGWVGRVWSVGETFLEILRHSWELNPGHREERRWDSFVLPLSYHDWRSRWERGVEWHPASVPVWVSSIKVISPHRLWLKDNRYFLWHVARPYLGKSVEETSRQAFPSSSLFQRILTSKYLHLLMVDMERLAQFWYIDLSAVIKACVETFQHWLRSQVQLQHKIFILFNRLTSW